MNVDKYGFPIFDEDFDNPVIKQEDGTIVEKKEEEPVIKEIPKEKKLEALF